MYFYIAFIIKLSLSLNQVSNVNKILSNKVYFKVLLEEMRNFIVYFSESQFSEKLLSSFQLLVT